MAERKTVVIHSNPEYRVGSHVSLQKPLNRNVDGHLKGPLRCVQIYLGGNVSFRQEPNFSPVELFTLKKACKNFDFPAFVHCCLCYNLCGSVQGTPDPEFHSKRDRMRRSFINELDVCSVSGMGAVVHTGSCKDKAEGMRQIAETLNYCMSQESSYTVKLSKATGIAVSDIIRGRRPLLENAAGEGSKLGSKLEEMYTVNSLLQRKVRYCIDTCHIYAAGQYDFGNMEHVDRFFEKERVSEVELYHLNDSKKGFGCKRDLHEILGQGEIWGKKESRPAFRKFMKRTRDIPLISETSSFSADYTFMLDVVPEVCEITEV